MINKNKETEIGGNLAGQNTLLTRALFLGKDSRWLQSKMKFLIQKNFDIRVTNTSPIRICRINYKI